MYDVGIYEGIDAKGKEEIMYKATQSEPPGSGHPLGVLFSFLKKTLFSHFYLKPF